MIPSEQEDIANNFNHRENILAEEITPIGVLRGGGASGPCPPLKKHG